MIKKAFCETHLGRAANQWGVDAPTRFNIREGGVYHPLSIFDDIPYPTHI
jgi:hypothetical protein